MYFSFDGSDYQKHPNFFTITQNEKKSKVEAAKYIVNEYFKGKEIHYFHENKRYKDDFTNILNQSKKQFHLHDLSKINDERLSEFLDPLLEEIKDDHLIIIDTKTAPIIHIFQYLHNHGKRLLFSKFTGLIKGRFSNYSFPLVEATTNNQLDLSLSMISLLNEINPILSPSRKKLSVFSIIQIGSTTTIISRV